MAITEKQRHELFTKAEEVLGEANAETLMSHLPPVGWADVATKHDIVQLKNDLVALEARLEGRLEARFSLVDSRLTQLADQLRAEFQRDLRQQLIAFLTANAVMLGLFTALR